MRHYLLYSICFTGISLASTCQVHTLPSNQLNNPLYLELTEWANDNYYHLVRDTLFPFFIALAKSGLNRRFELNVLYCDRQPFKPEVFRLMSNHEIRVAPYDPCTMRKITLASQNVSKYFPLFLAQLHERFAIKHTPAQSHKLTITLIQRNMLRRTITNFDELSRTLHRYCKKMGYVFKAVTLEHATFREQLLLADETDIFIAVHGAALTNAPFIRKNGRVIELTPYNFHNEFFKNFLHTCRPDIHYHSWMLAKDECTPTIAMPYCQNLQYRYWRDQAVRVNSYKLIATIQKCIAKKCYSRTQLAITPTMARLHNSDELP